MILLTWLLAACGGGGDDGGFFVAEGEDTATPTADIEPLVIAVPLLSDGTVGSSYSDELSASGGVEPFSWSVSRGELPPGLELNETDGTITGTPTSGGNFNFVVKVTDDNGSSDVEPAAIQVNSTGGGAPPEIDPPNLSDATTGVFYSQVLTAEGGVTPYLWEIAEGSLPPGLRLNDVAGTISGTPTQAGVFNFVIRVTDSVGATDLLAASITVEGSGAGQSITVDMRADDTLLPVNDLGFGPSIGGPFTTTVYVDADLPDGSPMPNGTTVQFAITGGLNGTGALYRLDGTDAVDEETGQLVAQRSIPVETASGTATVHFHAFDAPGTVTITATVADPNNNQLVSDSVTIQVGQPDIGADEPRQLLFQSENSTLFVQGSGNGPTRSRVTALVLDANDRPVSNPPPGVNNLRVELLVQSPQAGEELLGTNADGATMQGGVIFLRTINGVAS
ncbi:MAG: Ig domain-containing protein, partial [Candidatus Competibacteraceae bacterium]|nr:Ig domain-containing protein [Candidatus Competibacteraceae bacterium]